MRVFLGITGASGAPYAKRLVESLAAADCEVGVCASGAAVEVLATELYGDARHDRLGRDAEPDPPRGVRRAEGGAQARPVPARDTALDDPPREHADAAPGGRDDPLPRARLLPRCRVGR